MSNNYIRAGVLLRGQLRLRLAEAGFEFTETKTLLESVFTIPKDEEFEQATRALKKQGLLS